jgi:hypothetical protein
MEKSPNFASPQRQNVIAPEVHVEKIKVLLFAANPCGTDPLDLHREFREIDEEIRLGEFRAALELIFVPGTRVVDLLRKLNETRPNIVHFSGHGNIDEEIVIESGEGDLAISDRTRSSPVRDMRPSGPTRGASGPYSPRPLSKSALVDVLKACNEENIRVVVLNACHTRPQAEALSEVFDCVISMSRGISDEAAIKFAASFYGALSFGRSVKKAFDQGVARLKAEGVLEDETPVLLARAGVDASKLVLVGHRENAGTDTLPEGRSAVDHPRLLDPGTDRSSPVGIQPRPTDRPMTLSATFISPARSPLRLVYDNLRDDPSFDRWGHFIDATDLRRRIDAIAHGGSDPLESTIITDSQMVLELRAFSDELVGVNKRFPYLSGRACFEYQAVSSGALNSNLLFCVIPMQDDRIDGERLIEVGAEHPVEPENAYSPYRQRSFVPAHHVDDRHWHVTEIDFDFRSLPMATYIVLAPRVNEGCPRPGPGVLLVRNVRLFV